MLFSPPAALLLLSIHKWSLSVGRGFGRGVEKSRINEVPPLLPWSVLRSAEEERDKSDNLSLLPPPLAAAVAPFLRGMPPPGGDSLGATEKRATSRGFTDKMGKGILHVLHFELFWA